MPPSMGAADTEALPDVETPTAEGAPGGHANSYPHIRVQDDSHDSPQTLQPPNLSDDEHFLPRRLSSRPSFLEKMANSRETQFTLRRRQSTDVDRYFHGPRDLDKHSKWPIFMRLHGSVMPRLVLPLGAVALWATLVTCLSRFVKDLGIDNILLTVLGVVVGLTLSFRSSTAYERWADGRKYWSLLIQTTRNLARTIWIDTIEREGEAGKEDLLEKLTALNLILAFAVALKHRLRFEPDVGYEDLAGLVGHLETFAKEAHDKNALNPPPKSSWKAAGEYLGFSFAESNPRKLIKRSKKPLGNLPLEILNHLATYFGSCITNGTLPCSVHQGQANSGMATLNEVLTGTERVLDTPLPAAYTIAISQIAWIYILVLPFQLYSTLGWVTIPGSILAAYIILGLDTIGSEIENPFGHDVNDLPLDTYCRQIAQELDVFTAMPPPKLNDFVVREENLVLYPLSTAGYTEWKDRNVKEIRSSLKTKVVANVPSSAAASQTTLFGSMRTKQSV